MGRVRIKITRWFVGLPRLALLPLRQRFLVVISRVSGLIDELSTWLVGSLRAEVFPFLERLLGVV